MGSTETTNTKLLDHTLSLQPRGSNTSQGQHCRPHCRGLPAAEVNLHAEVTATCDTARMVSRTTRGYRSPPGTKKGPQIFCGSILGTGTARIHRVLGLTNLLPTSKTHSFLCPIPQKIVGILALVFVLFGCFFPTFIHLRGKKKGSTFPIHWYTSQMTATSQAGSDQTATNSSPVPSTGDSEPAM